MITRGGAAEHRAGTRGRTVRHSERDERRREIEDIQGGEKQEEDARSC